MTQTLENTTSKPDPKTMRVGIVTMGCDKNTVDNEYLAGLLEQYSIEVIPADDPEPSEELRDALDAVVITTCGFTEQAREENIERIIEWGEQKKSAAHPIKLYLSGCLSQRFSSELQESIPEIDGLVGVGQWKKLAQMIADDHPEIFYPQPDRSKVLVDLKYDLPRNSLDGRPYSYLKISDGCNHTCSFCSIPLMKGKLSSVPKEIIINEARGLIERGIQEINIVAQDTADYGRDRYGNKYRFAQLLNEILNLEGDFRVRLLYMYPAGINDALIDLLANHPKLCKYLDMPLQHLDPDVMKSMRRPYRDIHAEGLIEKIRNKVPDLALRTTFIVGFPGETEQAYKNLLESVKRIQFDWMGAFQFSIEEGTPSSEYENQIDSEVKQQRYEELMKLQSRITAERRKQMIGKDVNVIIEGIAEEPENWYVGRSEFEAPEVDGLVFIESDKPLQVGQMTRVHIYNSSTYDLFAKAV